MFIEVSNRNILGRFANALIGLSLSLCFSYKLNARALSDDDITVAVISDLNGSYGSTSYSDRVHDAIKVLSDRVRPDFVISTGDMVAGQKAGLNYQAMWESFHDAVTNKLKLADISLAPTPGNHDASAYRAFSQERLEYIKQWNRHKPKLNFVDDTNYPLYYSFRLGQTLFISLDATTVSSISKKQLAWVETQLQSNKAWAKSSIAFSHVPLTPVARGRESEILNDRSLETLLAQHDTLFIGGHHHTYYPGFSQGVRQIAIPCLGAGPRRLIGSDTRSKPGYVIIKISQGEVKSIEAFYGQGFSQKILRRSLPQQIIHGRHTFIRDDIYMRQPIDIISTNPN